MALEYNKVIIFDCTDYKVREMRYWLHDNTIGKYDFGFFVDEYFFEFETDAMAFKLRWA